MLTIRNFIQGKNKEVWIKIFNAAYKEYDDFRPETIEETKYFVETRPRCDIAEYFFAYLDGKPVGHVGVGIDTKFIKHKGIKRGWIMTIGVSKPLRIRGIGTAMMLYALKLLKTKGMTEVELGVDDSNPTKSIELYKKVGFNVVKKGPNLPKTIS